MWPNFNFARKNFKLIRQKMCFSSQSLLYNSVFCCLLQQTFFSSVELPFHHVRCVQCWIRQFGLRFLFLFFSHSKHWKNICKITTWGQTHTGGSLCVQVAKSPHCLHNVKKTENSNLFLETFILRICKW